MIPRLSLPALALSTVLAALPAVADPVDAATAQAMLYPVAGVEVVGHDVTGLSEQELAALMSVAGGQKYYAAVGFAPDAGILAEPTVLASNYHSPEAARAAALSGCDARRQGGRACALALEVRPAGWQPRPVMLSADATTGFNATYQAGAGPRALAISASSGLWGIGQGAQAAAEALAACRGESQVSDCAVVIAN